MSGSITIHRELIQGTDEWLAARVGLLTASEVKRIMTPKTLAFSQNDKTKAHVYEIAAQILNKHVEPQYVSDAMMRGSADEVYARTIYSERFAPVTEVGFITNDAFGFTLGYSPDGLVGDDGLIEIKSRCQKYQFRTIVDQGVPDEYILQIHFGMLVSDRQWCDFISYSGGMPFYVSRVERNNEMDKKITDAAASFNTAVSQQMATYFENAETLGDTERIIEQEMYV